MILNFFDTKFFKKADIDWKNTQKKDFSFTEIIKLQRNTTRISYFRTFLRYFAV